MRHAAALGLRLAWLGRGAARLRSLLVALAATVGTTVLLGAAGLVSADIAGNSARYADRGVIWLGMALVMGVAVPVMVLAATVGRLSAGLRGERLAHLRLLGLTPARTRLVAVTETGIASLAGALAGVVMAWAVGPLLARVPVWGQTFPAGWIAAPFWLVATVVVVVPLVVASVASLPARLGQARVLAGVRRAEARRPSAWRALPLIAGVGWCAWFASATGSTVESAGWLGFNLVGSVTLLGLGVLLVVPVVVRLVGDLVLLLADSPAVGIAARRIQAQPATMTRVVSGLLIGLFVVSGARCVVVAFESTPQYVAAAYNVEVEQRSTLEVRQDRVDDVLSRLRTLTGIRGTVVQPALRTGGGCRDGLCLSAVVLSCGDLARLSPGVRGCRDDAPVWVGSGRDGASGPWPAEDGGAVRLSRPTTALTGGELPAWQAIDADVVIPPRLAQRAGLAVDRVQIEVLADPGRGLDDSLGQAGFSSFSTWGTDDYDDVATLRAVVWSVGALVVSLGLLSFGIAAVDRAVERRREVVALQVVGVPAGVLRRAQWIEVAAPLVTGSVLAVVAGLSAGATYLALDPAARLPWQAAALLAVLGCVGGATVAGLTVLASSPRIRPELIRTE